MKKNNRVVFLLVCLCLIGLTSFFYYFIRPEKPTQHAEVVNTAWVNLIRQQKYQFTTSVQQITYPAPTINNAGESSTTETYFISGQTDLETEKLFLNIWQSGGGVLNGEGVISIKIEDQQAYGKAEDADWIKLDQFDYTSIAPGQDAASYLSTAKNVKIEGIEIIQLPDINGVLQDFEVTHYRFDVDSIKYADLMRDQLLRELERKGKLPIGMNLDLSDQYRDMEAQGEVWINSKDLPVRMSVVMEFPALNNGERVKAIIITDFTTVNSPENKIAGFPTYLMGTFGLTSFQQLITILQTFTLILFSLLFVSFLFRFTSQKVQLAVISITVILSMVISPVWNSVKAAEFTDEIKSRNETQQTTENAEDSNEYSESEWDIHKGLDGKNVAFAAALLGITNKIQSFGINFSVGYQPLMETVGDEEADQDGDGLTDTYEDDFDDEILDKTKADTDGDGLWDGVELKLNLLPGDSDSDNDRIEDAVEVVSFFYADQDWYIDPSNNDTDGDGILDGVECRERVISDDNPIPGICRDFDGDGIPDVFDEDDDGDQVPSNVDSSPYYYNPEIFTESNPLRFQVENLDSNLPAILDLQIRPENSEHLTYIMNVLDWPSGDNDGQIMRVTDSTFADGLSSDQNSQDPKAANGDMRLIPMLEFRIDGSSIPFPLSDSMEIGFNNDNIEAVFKITTSTNGHVQIEKINGPSETLTLKLATGNCDEFSGLETIGTYNPDGNFTMDTSLGSIAEGEKVFILEDSDGDELGCTQPFAAHGNLSDQVVDVRKLAQYGASARNDIGGDILVYVPLTLDYDITESAPIGFHSRIPYFNEEGRLNSGEQEVKMVWMLNMITDVCKEIPSDYDLSDDGEWCDPDEHSHWISDVPRVVHTYDDAFRVTGMTFYEDHGIDLDVIFEDPQTDETFDYDDWLWGMAYGLQGTYVSGDEELTLAEIYNRWDREANVSIYDEEDSKFWGMPQDAFQVEQYHYDSEDDQYQFVSETVYDLLDNYFDPYKSELGAVTLLFARDKFQRSVNAGETRMDCSSGSCVFNFDGTQLITQAMLNWAPYQWDEDEWKTYPLADYLDLLEMNLRKAEDFNVSDATDEDRDVIDGKISMARFTYETYFRGIAMVTRLDGQPLVDLPEIIDDQDIYNQFYKNNIYGRGVTKAFTAFVDILLRGWHANPNMESIWTAKNFFKSLKDGLGQKVSKINSVLNSNFKKAAFGIAAAVIIIGLAVCAILYLTNPDSLGGKIGGRILFTAIGLAMMGLAITSLTEVSAIAKAGSAVSNSVKGAAIIGAIVGIVVTWGIFFYTWSSSGASAFSLEFNSMLADAIAATMTVILMAVLMMTGIGALIVGIIALIDGLITAICGATGVYEEDDDHWARQYVCIGISGWITKIFKWFIYSQTFIVKYDDEKRLEFVDLDTDIQNDSDGMVSGNHMKLTVSIKNTITKSSVPLDWKALAYFWQYSDSNAKSAAFKYKVQISEDDFDDEVDRGDNRSDWVSAGDKKWSMEVDKSTSGFPIELPAAGINRDLTAYVSEGAAIPVQECWVIPPNPFTLFMWIPVCYVRTYSNTIHIDMSDSLTVDVFPPTLDEFYALTQLDEYGYALAWGRDASLKFPKLRDADGDSLVSKAFAGGNDPDDSLYDTDNDGLSDYYEISNGTDPRLFDSDDDGLYDLVEIQHGSDPLRKDSDGDGLTDDLEIQGWFFVYDFEADGTPLETMVYSDPLVADTDFDGITDLLEKIYGFNPNAPSDPNILEYKLDMREYDSPAIMLRFEEDHGANMFADSSNFRFDGFCENDGCPVSGITGRYGYAARFDGNQVVTLTTTGTAFSYEENQPFTLSGWVKWSEAGTLIAKWHDDVNAKNGFRLMLNPAGNLELVGVLETISSSDSIPSGTWTHYTVTFDGTEVGFYLNGTKSACNLGSCTWDNSLVYSDGMMDVPMMVGAYDGAGGLSSPFSGLLDEVTVFNRALNQQEIQERQITARYNFNDNFVRPGEEIAYQSLVKNLLNNRFAYGLVSTTVDKPEVIVDSTIKFAPKTIVLYPDNPVVTGVSEEYLEETIQINPGVTETTDVTIEQSVSAQIVDRRTESNFAELWLKFNEAVGATEFEDSSGNMPPRSASCLGLCPISGETGILNQSVKIQANTNQTLALPDLERLDMVNRGYTISLWVKPGAPSASMLPIITSLGNRFGLGLAPSGADYTPVIYQNGSQPVYTPWRKIKTGVWNHLVFVYSSTTRDLEIYINGARVSTIGGINPISANADLVFGGVSQTVDFWVDDLRTFGRPLSYLDISRLAEKPVLNLTMDSTFTDQSDYNQSVSSPKNWPTYDSNAIRGSSLNPGSGSSQGYIQVTGNEMLDLSDGAFTISMWLYPQTTSSSSWQGIFGKHELNNEENSYVTLERNGQKLKFGFGDGSAYRSKTSGDILPTNRWSNILISFQPNQFGQYEYKLYLDSELKDSYLFDQKPTNASSFYVGHSSNVYRLWIGNLDMDDEHDAGSHAEVYLEAYIGGAYQYDIPSSGEHEMADGDVWYINRSMTESSYRSLEYEVWEDDSTSGDDYCGHVEKYWYSDNASGSADLSNGFDGELHYTFTRNSIQFVGKIDEFEMYRYAVNSEQVMDIYQSIPITVNMPLNDRPSADSFENKAVIGDIDDGDCVGLACPAAGTIGLLNQAVRFDGINDQIEVPVNTTSSYMVSFWINSDCEDCGVFSLKSGTSTIQEIYTSGGNICGLTGTTEICSHSANLLDEQWHHVVYNNNQGNIVLWLDGEIVNQMNGSTVPAVNNGTAILGMAPSAESDYLSGKLDDVRIFRYSQSDSIVQQLYHQAPFLLAHLEDDDLSDGVYDDTDHNWLFTCAYDEDPSISKCPKAGVNGRLINGMEFDAQNDILSLSQPILSDDLDEFTVSLWINPVQSFNHLQTLWTLWDKNNTSIKYGLALVADGLSLCVLSASDSSNCDVDSNVELIANNWNHVTFVVQRTSSTQETYQLYINGYLDSEGIGNQNGEVTSGLGRLDLGNQVYGSNSYGSFGGILDEVSLYSYALNEINIRDAFHYQMEHVEETDSLTMTIDADQPQGELVSYTASFPYTPNIDKLLHYESVDVTSGIALVEMTTQFGSLGVPRQTTSPLCLDSDSRTSFCPTLDPVEGEGTYSVNFRTVDNVGNQTEDGPYIYYVDGTGPRIVVDFVDGEIVGAKEHQTIENTWYLSLTGHINDELLADGHLGSGLDTETVQVTLFSEAGEETGNGMVKPQLTQTSNGYDWSVDYLFRENEPTGKLILEVRGKDKVGNETVKTTAIYLDATAPFASLNEGVVPNPETEEDLDYRKSASKTDEDRAKILTQSTISGTASDIPGLGLPYMNDQGEQAATNVTSVQTGFTPALQASFQYNEPYPQGLLAWYPLDKEEVPVDEEGNPDPENPDRYYLDISPQQISGNCSGEECPNPGLIGHKNGSMFFNGVQQRINLGTNVDLSNQSFAISLWAQRDEVNVTDPFLWQGPVTLPDQRFLFGFNADNQLVCGFGGSDLVSKDLTGDNKWHYWSCTYDLDSGIRSLWKDGQLLIRDNTNPIPLMSENLYLGAAPVGSFKGHLDELVILDHALTAEEIREQYTAYQMVFYLDGDDEFVIPGDTMIDQSGYYNQVQLFSATTDHVNKSLDGIVGRFAFAFDGDDSLLIDPAFNLNLDRAHFTQTAWVYPVSLGESIGLFSQTVENLERRYPSVLIMPDGSIKAGFGTGYDWVEIQTQPGLVQQNEWSFIAASFDGERYKIYLNDHLVLNSTDLNGSLPYPSEAFEIGNGLIGIIDELVIFPRALDPFEVLAMYNSSWKAANLLDSGNEVSWETEVPFGLEGPYNLDVRAGDGEGHYLTDLTKARLWGGVVDSFAPRMTLTRELTGGEDPHQLLISFEIYDPMLDPDSIHQNLCEGIELEKTYFNSSWYLAGGVAPNSSLYMIRGTCFSDDRTTEETGIIACDAAENCSGVTFPAMLPEKIYLPLVIGGEGSGTDITQNEHQEVEALLERAKSWPTLSESLKLYDNLAEADAWISDQIVTYEDIRNIMNINLHGEITNRDSISDLTIRIYHQDQLVVESNAAVYESVWNAFWPYPLGDPPEDGSYLLELILTDKSGITRVITQTIDVQLH